MRKHPIHLIIKALESGMEITDKEIAYCFSDRNRLAMVVTRNETKECFELDFSFNSMMAFAENLPEETLVALAATLAIQNEKI